jgi:hypothetical protein
MKLAKRRDGAWEKTPVDFVLDAKTSIPDIWRYQF